MIKAMQLCPRLAQKELQVEQPGAAANIGAYQRFAVGDEQAGAAKEVAEAKEVRSADKEGAFPEQRSMLGWQGIVLETRSGLQGVCCFGAG